ncbi:DUF2442 domain-containing protein [Aequorivita vladivostokensis]|uniref:DUF2442 domain-containing protein n=1 Tax=Aequorivita vladivostokensis TaxID=171194 RepID=A0ABR5DI79_9FLAO|nr:DUF2442 domain-containing protein [Aequorivita vladivostokensis]MAB56481.1 DUF2442 domain-containing protein [Aequorivita sp.]KJJ38473.1 hypothetical protein MB09_07170 [Aequorivita vladivostokensis]MAO47918.1 DUF2442 domain-containing protein [Aequorivita sp.]MBF29857.1 DUF2442 domain-containing protein [Aequorivita sp.]HAV55004.1 DUF2442 domain-containing protein [Aequorivita sp.]|tara:strand:+ start:38319 stop:38552 length:234 start_codon:yes stop_codon:yes gene_type:complete
MSISIIKSNNAVSLSFENHKMKIFLEDGRELSIPMEWFPKLRDATENELNNWRFIGDGEGIHWKDLDEDILIENLLN